MTESLLKEAQAIGAKSLVLCPLNDGSEVPASETLGALRDLAPLFAFYGIHGLVEPLGFPQSSLRSAHQAQTLIHDARVPFAAARHLPSPSLPAGGGRVQPGGGGGYRAGAPFRSGR